MNDAAPAEGGKKGRVRKAVALALTYMGVPATTARKLAGPISKALPFIAAIPLMFPLVLFSVVAGSEDQAAARATETVDEGGPVATNPEAYSRVPASLLAAYREAAARSVVPWTLLAAVGELSSGSGRGMNSSSYGSMMLAPSSGWVPPGTGRTVHIEHAGPLSEIPERLHGLEVSAGDVVVVSPLPPLVGETEGSLGDAVARASLAVPGSVVVMWWTVDMPDWQEREVKDCKPVPSAPPGSEGPAEIVPEEPECTVTVEDYIASDRNMLEHLNEALYSMSADMPPNFVVMDFEPVRGPRLMRPGPTGGFSDPQALDGPQAISTRLSMEAAEKARVASLTKEEPSGECPTVASDAGGVGVFGLDYEALVEYGIVSRSISPSRLEDVCYASYVMVRLLERAAADEAQFRGRGLRPLLKELGNGARGDLESKESLDEFWTQVMFSVSPVFSEGADPCSGLFYGSPPRSTADAIADAWRCVVETRDIPQWDVLEAEAGRELQQRRLDSEAAARRAVADALGVSWRYSKMQPCQLFPMTAEQFEAHKPDIEAADRCTPVVEAYAAAQLFASSASEASSIAGWGKSVAGWQIFESVLGDSFSRGEFASKGPWRTRYYPLQCRREASEVLSGISTLAAPSLTVEDISGVQAASADSPARQKLQVSLDEASLRIYRSSSCADIFNESYEALVLISGLPMLASIGEDSGYSGGEPTGVDMPEDAIADPESPAASARSVFIAISGLAQAYSVDSAEDLEGAPLLARASHRPFSDRDPYGSSVRGTLPSGAFTSRAMALIYSQMPGLFSGMAWEMGGYGLVPESIPHSASFNLQSQGVDPRLVLALARHHGPLDALRGCDGVSTGSYGLFGLSDRDLGCSTPSDQVAFAASTLMSLKDNAGGSFQGAVYAWLSDDPRRTAELWVASGWDIRAFSDTAQVDLASLGPGGGRSPLSFWYEHQMSYVGIVGSTAEEASYTLGVPMYLLGDYDGSMSPPTPTTIVRSCPGGCYGIRNVHPATGARNVMHWGVDFSHPRGTPIRSVADGVVTVVGFRTGWGNTVMVDHGSGVVSLYAHLDAFATSPGQEVVSGQLIGFVGSTGRSTGPHLHFELVISGLRSDPCEPRGSGYYIPCTFAFR